MSELEALVTYERDGIVGTVNYDDEPSNPRDWDSNLAVLVEVRDGHGQPDGNGGPATAQIVAQVREAWARSYEARAESRPRWHLFADALVERYARAYLGAAAVGWLEDGSGSRIFGMVTKASAAGEGDPQAILDGELAAYGQYLAGTAYAYQVLSGEEWVAACGDMFGDVAYAEGEMRAEVDAAWRERHEARARMFRGLVAAR